MFSERVTKFKIRKLEKRALTKEEVNSRLIKGEEVLLDRARGGIPYKKDNGKRNKDPI